MAGVLIITIFLVLALLMVFRKISTMLALILMGILMAAVAGVPWLGKDGILSGIFAKGVVSLAVTDFAVIFGGWLGAVMEQTGIASTLVRKAAELGGDRPYLTAFFIMLVGIPIGLVTGSAPAAMLVGLVGLPAMLTLGLAPEVAATTILFGLGTGWAASLYIWQYFAQVLKLSIPEIAYFGVKYAFVVLALGTIFLVFEAWKARSKTRIAWAASGASVGVASGASAAITAQRNTFLNAPWYSLITPLIPISLVLGLHWDILSSFFVAILYGLLTTQPKRFSDLFLKSAYRGFEISASPVFIFVGVGILATAVSNPMVANNLRPILQIVVPTSAIGYILFFALLAPLAVYRGPLNIYGLGGGVAAVMMAAKVLSPHLILGAMAAVAQVLYISDPTSTQVVWSSEYAGTTPEKVFFKAIPFTWLTAVLGVLLSAYLYLHL